MAKNILRQLNDMEFESDTPQKKSASKVLVVLGIVLLLIVIGSTSMRIASQKTLAQPQLSKQEPSHTLSLALPNGNEVVDSLKTSVSTVFEKSANIVGTAVQQKAKEAGSAVLGAAVGLVEKKASESAQVAQKIVLQSTVEGIKQQIEKLPKDQQLQIKEVLCK